MIITYCPTCGEQLSWMWTLDHWGAEADCECGRSWGFSEGDRMGGQSDSFYELDPNRKK